MTRFFLFILISVVVQADSFASEMPRGEGSSSVYMVKKGKLVRLLIPDLFNGGQVLAFREKEGRVFYVISRNGEIYAGVLNNGEKIEVKVASFPEEEVRVRNLQVEGTVLFFLLHRFGKGGVERSNSSSILFRCDLNSSTLQWVKGVNFYKIIWGKPLLVRNNVVSFNGRVIHLEFSGLEGVSSLGDRKLLFKNGQGDFQIFDIVMWKNVFFENGNHYSGSFLGDKNLVIVFSDSRSGNEKFSFGPSVFYSISFDDGEAGRTISGTQDMERDIFFKVATGRMVSLKIERWVLNSDLKRYVRENNVRQPGILRVFIPRGGFVRLNVSFDGAKYRFYRESYMKKPEN